MIQKRQLSSENIEELEDIEIEIDSLNCKITNCLKNLKPKKQSKKFKNHYNCYD